MAACYQVQALSSGGRPIYASSGVQAYGFVPDSTPLSSCTGVVVLDPADYGVLQAGSIWSSFTADQASVVIAACVVVWGAAAFMRDVLRFLDGQSRSSNDEIGE